MGSHSGWLRQAANCVICGRNEARVQEVADRFLSMGLRVTGIGCDVGDERSVQEMVEKTADVYGTVDILVNNAGNYPMLKLQETTQEDWDARRISATPACIWLPRRAAL